MLLSSTYALAAGEISMLRGEASIIRGTAKLDAKVQMPIKAKDAIKTKKNSKAQITFKDKTVVTIGADTVFSVEDYLFEDKKSSAKFNVKGGSFKVITGKIGKLAPKSFLLKTKTSLIGIRGTVFAGQVGDKEQAERFACFEGSIRVTSAKTGQSKIVNKGKMVSVNKDGSMGNAKSLDEESFKSFSNQEGRKTENKQKEEREKDDKQEEADNISKPSNLSDADKELELDNLRPDINTLISEKTTVTYKGKLEGTSKAITESSTKKYETKAKIKADMKADIDFGGNSPLKVTISDQKLTLEEAKVNGAVLTGSNFDNAKQALSDNNLNSTMNMQQTLNPDALTIKGKYEKTANGLTTNADLNGKFNDKYVKKLDGTLNETTKGEVNGVKIDRSINSNFKLEQD